MCSLTGMLSPGLAYVIDTILPRYGGPPLAIWAAYHGIEHLGYSDRVPTSLATPYGIVLASMGYHIARSILLSIRDTNVYRREMRALNATFAPRAGDGWLPGNIDTLFTVITNIDKEYLGYPMPMFKKIVGNLYSVTVLGEYNLHTDNPACIKEMLVTDQPNFVKGAMFEEAARSMLGSGIFNSDGENWKFHRSMTRPFFSKERVTDFHMFDRHSRTTMEKIRERCGGPDKLPIDIQDLVQRFTMDCATEFLFGRCVQSLSAQLPLPGEQTADASRGANEFAWAFRGALLRTIERLQFQPGDWRLKEIFGDRTSRYMKALYSYLDPMIDEALEKRNTYLQDEAPNGIEGEGHENTNLLSHLVSVTTDRAVIHDELLNILLAGRDTTATTTTFVIYFLALHPNVRVRLRKEIIDAMGSGFAPLTFDKIKELKYMRAVINETLRLLPPVAFNVREAVRSTVFVNPVTGVRTFVPHGTKVFFNILTMHRDVDLWGPDALKFDPDRWLDERNTKYFLANPFIFLPFSAGPRICIGQQFAYNEISYFVSRFLQAFDTIELAPDAHPPGSLPPKEWKTSDKSRESAEEIIPQFSLTLYSKGGLWVRISRSTSVDAE